MTWRSCADTFLQFNILSSLIDYSPPPPPKPKTNQSWKLFYLTRHLADSWSNPLSGGLCGGVLSSDLTGGFSDFTTCSSEPDGGGGGNKSSFLWSSRDEFESRRECGGWFFSQSISAAAETEKSNRRANWFRGEPKSWSELSTVKKINGEREISLLLSAGELFFFLLCVRLLLLRLFWKKNWILMNLITESNGWDEKELSTVWIERFRFFFSF